MRQTASTFDDILILPKFSKVGSRKDITLATDLGNGLSLDLPVISSNMASITGAEMVAAMAANGGLGILHRFCSIDENVKELVKAKRQTFRALGFGEDDEGPASDPAFLNKRIGVSVGISDTEKERAEALIGASNIVCVDVAHGAQQAVVDMVTWLREKYGDSIFLIVGNFATGQSIADFKQACKDGKKPDIYKVGVGPGSVCTTRLKTGVGVPQISAIGDCARIAPIIADGGIRFPGDIAKALAQGAKAVMLGGMLAATDETPGDIHVYKTLDGKILDQYKTKVYEGSALGGYGNGWKTSEGAKTHIACKGPVGPILKDIEGGLRSSFSYVGALNLKEFQSKAELVLVSSASITENGPHGVYES